MTTVKQALIAGALIWLAGCQSLLQAQQGTLTAACTAYVAALQEATTAIAAKQLTQSQINRIAADSVPVLGPPGQKGGGICTNPPPTAGYAEATTTVTLATAGVVTALQHKGQ